MRSTDHLVFYLFILASLLMVEREVLLAHGKGAMLPTIGCFLFLTAAMAVIVTQLLDRVRKWTPGTDEPDTVPLPAPRPTNKAAPKAAPKAKTKAKRKAK